MDHDRPRQHRREDLRFPSDATDEEWAVLEPLLPSPSPVGRPPAWPLREILDAIFYVLRGGIPWRMLPDCFPPYQTVYGWFAAFRDTGVWEALNHAPVLLDRDRAGREASPTAAVQLPGALGLGRVMASGLLSSLAVARSFSAL